MESFLKTMNLDIKDSGDIRMMSPLVLAYIGDAIYEAYIRTYIIHKYNGKVSSFHKIATRFVKASAQARIVHALMDNGLDEDEIKIIKRGRNQKSFTVPKNAELSDYKYATGFEAMIGYLYLKGEKERLEEIIVKSIAIIEDDRHEE